MQQAVQTNGRVGMKKEETVKCNFHFAVFASYSNICMVEISFPSVCVTRVILEVNYLGCCV